MIESFRNPKEMCLYIGDIGDNRFERQNIKLYKIKEPILPLDQINVHETTSNWEVFTFQYPNGQAYNAESILIDSNSREFIVITKLDEPPYSLVFSASLESNSEMLDTGIRLPLNLATDATSSADGQVWTNVKYLKTSFEI